MAIRELLVYVDNDRHCATRVNYAADLARGHEASLTGIYLKRTVEVPSYASAYLPPEVLDAGEQALTELADAAEQVFRENAGEQSGGLNWEIAAGPGCDGLSARARYADFTILAQYDPEDPDMNVHYRPDSVIFDAGRPLLLVPYAGRFEVPERALVAWDGSREAARALHDALPLLQVCTRVDLVSVGNPEDGESEVVRYLQRQGVSAEHRWLPSADLDAADALLSYASDLGSNLIVMGGYGHSRLRELVLGGMTRHLLAHMTVPVLLSH